MVGAKHIGRKTNENGEEVMFNIDERDKREAPTPPYNAEGQCNFLHAQLQQGLRKKTYFDSSPSSEEPRSPRPRPNFANKIYIAPLTTVGNLPFRRIVKEFGADITCGEMAIAKNLVMGEKAEWSLVRRHKSEDVFGVQLAGGDAKMLSKAIDVLDREVHVDFVDLNLGCPIDLICDQGAGSALLNRHSKLEEIVRQITARTKGRMPLGLKVRTGWATKKPTSHTLSSLAQTWKHTLPYGNAISYFCVHGRSRTARYTNFADWDFAHRVSGRVIATESLYRKKHTEARHLTPLPVFGNGDIMGYEDWVQHTARVEDWVERIQEIEAECEDEQSRIANALNKGVERIAADAIREEDEVVDDLENLKAQLTTCMIGRGALIKPWISTEIKEKRHWDISGSERFDMLQRFSEYGLEHWGSDIVGVEKTRRFLLEWLSFTCRYVPIGLLEPAYVPQTINDRPPHFVGRDDRETRLASHNVEDWIKLTEDFLGKAPDGFQFEPKHKSNSYSPTALELVQDHTA